MSSVVILPDSASGQTLKGLLAELAELTPGKQRTTGSGVVVSWEVAQTYLNRTLGVPPSSGNTAPELTPTPGPTADPIGPADAAGQAADGGGSPPDTTGGAPAAEPTPAAPRKTTTPKARKTTPVKKTTAAAQQRASRSTRSNP